MASGLEPNDYKSFCQRKKGLFNKSHLMHTKFGADVFTHVRLPNGVAFSYQSGDYRWNESEPVAQRLTPEDIETVTEHRRRKAPVPHQPTFLRRDSASSRQAITKRAAKPTPRRLTVQSKPREYFTLASEEELSQAGFTTLF